MNVDDFAKALRIWFDEQLKKMFCEREGGRLRALKGRLVEEITDKIICYAWQHAGRKEELHIARKMYTLPAPGEKKGYRISLDRQVYAGEIKEENLVTCVECKAYAEVAMYKRVILDCKIIREALKRLVLNRAEKLRFSLLILESQLGGDFATAVYPCKKSPPVRAIDALFEDIKLEVLVLMDGERDITRPIHKKQYKKSLREGRIKRAVDYFTTIFREWY